MKHQVAEILDDIVNRLERIEANQTITNTTLREVSQVAALTHDMVRELHTRFIELADDTGAEILALQKRVGINGRGRS